MIDDATVTANTAIYNTVTAAADAAVAENDNDRTPDCCQTVKLAAEGADADAPPAFQEAIDRN